MTWLVEHPVTWVLPSGEQRSGRIAVGVPELVPGGGGDATCAFALDGLETGRGPLRGHGALQALLLALQFIGLMLHDYLARGYRVLDPDQTYDPDLATAGLISVFGPLIRAPGDERGPADPEGKLAALEHKRAELGRLLANELSRLGR